MQRDLAQGRSDGLTGCVAVWRACDNNSTTRHATLAVSEEVAERRTEDAFLANGSKVQIKAFDKCKVIATTTEHSGGQDGITE